MGFHHGWVVSLSRHYLIISHNYYWLLMVMGMFLGCRAVFAICWLLYDLEVASDGELHWQWGRERRQLPQWPDEQRFFYGWLCGWRHLFGQHQQCRQNAEAKGTFLACLFRLFPNWLLIKGHKNKHWTSWLQTIVYLWGFTTWSSFSIF